MAGTESSKTLVSKDGEDTITTDSAVAATRLRAAGYRMQEPAKNKKRTTSSES